MREAADGGWWRSERGCPDLGSGEGRAVEGRVGRQILDDLLEREGVARDDQGTVRGAERGA